MVRHVGEVGYGLGQVVLHTHRSRPRPISDINSLILKSSLILILFD